MNNKTDILKDVAVNPATGFKPLPDLIAFDQCKAYPVPGGNLLLRNTRTGKREMITTELYATLLSCEKFATLDEHVTRIIKLNPGMRGQQADIRQVLKTMVDAGMLVSAKNYCDALKGQPGKTPGQPQTDKPVVVIITWERPEALQRLLASIQQNCASEKFHQLYVVDDSRKDENIKRNRELVANAAFGLKTQVQYMGQPEQQKLLAQLAAKLPGHEQSIRFLADQSLWRDQWTSGLARNLALLLSCGRRLVMMDDDTICDVFEPGELQSDISISDLPREADFFSSEHEWKGQRQALNPDPVNRHMQCLGLPLADALDTFGQHKLKPAGLSSASTAMLNRLNPTSRVLVTECGSLGCPGTNTNTWLPDMSPRSIRHMLSSPEKVHNALYSRMVWTGRLQPHFGARPNMSQITGFDNRAMLPPYFPIGRGEDRLFGVLLNFIFPNDLSLDYPWAIPHLPIPKREWTDKDRQFKQGPSFPYFFAVKLPGLASECHAVDPLERLRILSACFADMAASSKQHLFESDRDSTLRSMSAQIKHLSELLEGAGNAPQEWQDYLQDGIKQLGASLGEASSENYPVKGRPVNLQGDELIAYWQKNWADFSTALQSWPAIRAAAQELLNPWTQG